MLWKGWPEEQASWLSSDNWSGCEEAIAEYEARGVGVSALQAARARRGQETEDTRKAAVRETLENHPRATDCPPVNKQGQIDMGSQRCAADTKVGCWCKARTKHGCYCWVHRAARDGTRIKKATGAGSGLGLFAARFFARRAIVARYTGDLVNTMLGARANGFDGSHYVLEMTEQLAIDAARTNTADGRMINDARGSGKRPNVRFVCNQQTKTVTIRTTRAVRAGEEFLLSYGRSFWGAQQEKGAPPQKKYTATKGSVARKEAEAQKERAAGASEQAPVVLASSRIIRVNMLRRRGAAPGEWIDNNHWLCNCRWDDNRRAAVVDGCPTCHLERPEWNAQQLQQQQLQLLQQQLQQQQQQQQQVQQQQQQQQQLQQLQQQLQQLQQQQQQQQAAGWSRFADTPEPPRAEGARAADEPPYFAQAAAMVAALAAPAATSAAAPGPARPPARCIWPLPRPSAQPSPWISASAVAVPMASAPAETEEMAERAQAWRDAPLYRGSAPRITRGDESSGPRLTERDWEQQADENDTDCRGVASKFVAVQARHKVMRVTARKEGYCRRSTCECCAPHPEAGPGMSRGQWCSCRAVLDGLCRRCWLDYHGGQATWKSQYWGPK